MSELGNVPLWQLKETIEFGDNESVELPNGNRRTVFNVAYTKKAARFRISDRQMNTKNGLNLQNNHDFVIRHRKDVDYNAYKARWRGKIYNVTHIVPDNSKLITYDIVSLQNNDKNG